MLQLLALLQALHLEATGDTAAGDNAAIGYTAAEGLILTGQGSTGDITIKNDADAVVLQVPTGTTNVNVIGSIDVATQALECCDWFTLTPEENTRLCCTYCKDSGAQHRSVVKYGTVESSSVRGVFGADNNGSDPKTIIVYNYKSSISILYHSNNAGCRKI